MENILIVSDFIEGKPVVASVRFNDLMKHFSKDYNIFLMHNGSFDENKSVYSKAEMLYYSSRSRFTQDLGQENKKASKLEKLLRTSLVLKLWRTYSYSKYKFGKLNRQCLHTIGDFIKQNSIKKVFITVPDIHGIYIGKYIKDNIKDVIIVYEIRDLINHSIGKGNPTFILKKADRYIKESADGIIALSKGIKDFYGKFIPNKPVVEIKNGYGDEFDQLDDRLVKKTNNNTIVLSHIGSIYKGRNVGDLIRAMDKYSKERNKKIEFNIVGVLDKEAYQEIDASYEKGASQNFKVNIYGPLAHEKAIQVLFVSDIAVILTHKKGSDFAIPGKTYEYIGAEKPVLAISRDKTLVDFLDGRYGFCADHNIDDIFAKLELILETSFDFSDKALYSRRQQYKSINDFILKVYERKNNKYEDFNAGKS